MNTPIHCFTIKNTCSHVEAGLIVTLVINRNKTYQMNQSYKQPPSNQILVEILTFFLHLFIVFLPLCACSNSECMNYANYAEIAVDNNDSSNADNFNAQNAQSSPKITDYLPLNDTKYPYAGIPRIVVETENHREIKDRETKIPAKLQIWGENAPESEVMNLTIRGRGNTSWATPKKSYKIEFIDKQTILGMPKDRDWALIANYADKTLMKNYLMYHLSTKLGAYYAPRCEFVEFYLNKEYLGIYLLTETIKIAKKRINIPENETSYILEVDKRTRPNDQKIYSHVIDSIGKGFQVHSPKNVSAQTLEQITEFIQTFESYLKSIRTQTDNNISHWIDVDEYIKHYWVQEFSKNPDANFYSSVYFSWTESNPIKMGPVWDFDLAFGGHDNANFNTPNGWHLETSYWNAYLFQDSVMKQLRKNFWTSKRDVFQATFSVVDSVQLLLQNAAKNNFKKWNILQSTEYIYHTHKFESYPEAIENLKHWITERLQWIDRNL